VPLPQSTHGKISMDSTTTTVRMPLRRRKRIPAKVTLAPETHVYLARIGDGNRSAAIEELVRLHRARELAPVPRSSLGAICGTGRRMVASSPILDIREFGAGSIAGTCFQIGLLTECFARGHEHARGIRLSRGIRFTRFSVPPGQKNPTQSTAFSTHLRTLIRSRSGGTTGAML
jgi:hypothetical protein